MVSKGYNGVRTEFNRGRVTKSGQNEYVCEEKVLKCPCKWYWRYAKQNQRHTQCRKIALI